MHSYRLSIRTLLLLVAVIAVAFAWYARKAAARAAEKRALEKIESLTVGPTVVLDSDDGPAYTCGTWSGGVIHTEVTGPPLLRWMKLDAFRRVTSVTLRHEFDPELVIQFDAFDELEDVAFSQARSSSGRDAELIGALLIYGSLHPNVIVLYDGESDLTGYWRQRMASKASDGPFDDFESNLDEVFDEVVALNSALEM